MPLKETMGQIECTSECFCTTCIYNVYILLSVHLSIDPFIYPSLYLSIYPSSIHSSIHSLFIHLSVHPSVHLATYPSSIHSTIYSSFINPSIQETMIETMLDTNHHAIFSLISFKLNSKPTSPLHFPVCWVGGILLKTVLHKLPPDCLIFQGP